MIEVKNLTKQYSTNTAVNNISFTIEEGKIYGFLGPNGAGKSTTMNIITGCLAATSGSVTINGFDIFAQPIEAKKCIGYLPEIPPLYPDMTPLEFLKFVARAKGVKKSEMTEQIAYAMEKTDILDVKDKLIKHLSKGYKQRVGIAQAILGNPKVIILDEPTVGLDPKQIVEIRALIKELGEKHTVILSSHILPEVSEVCEEILIISHGNIVACDTTENLISKFNHETLLEITVKDSDNKANQILECQDFVTAVEISSNDDGTSKLTVHSDSKDDIREAVAKVLMANEILILSMGEIKASLEDIFLEVAGDNIDVFSQEDSNKDEDTEKAEIEEAQCNNEQEAEEFSSCEIAETEGDNE